MTAIERNFEHWYCATCESVNGPVDGFVCVICREESVNSEVVGLVPESQLRGAIEALKRYGGHDIGCSMVSKDYGDKCTCGLDRAFATLGEQ